MSLRTRFSPLGGASLPFKTGTVLYEADGATAKTQWLTLPQGIYELTACGAGGTAAAHLNLYAINCTAGGGSGGFAKVDVKIPKGKYLIFPGTTNVRDSGIQTEDGTQMFLAYNGSNAKQQSNTLTPVAAGAGGGVLYPSKFEVVNNYNWTGGNNGAYSVGGSGAGGASVDPYNGYGKGADGGTSNNGTGYIKLVYKGKY